MRADPFRAARVAAVLSGRPWVMRTDAGLMVVLGDAVIRYGAAVGMISTMLSMHPGQFAENVLGCFAGEKGQRAFADFINPLVRLPDGRATLVRMLLAFEEQAIDLEAETMD